MRTASKLQRSVEHTQGCRFPHLTHFWPWRNNLRFLHGTVTNLSILKTFSCNAWLNIINCVRSSVNGFPCEVSWLANLPLYTWQNLTQYLYQQVQLTGPEPVSCETEQENDSVFMIIQCPESLRMLRGMSRVRLPYAHKLILNQHNRLS